MADRYIELDQFGATLNQILSEVERDVKDATPEGVKEGLKEGAKEWRKNARSTLGGKKYKKSIRWHMIRSGGDTPAGEIGSSMPGLPHLLEKGHARVGGGRVRAIPHIEPAAEVAFDKTMEAILDGIGRTLG